MALDTSHAPAVVGVNPDSEARQESATKRTVIVSCLPSEGRKFVEVAAEDLFSEYGGGSGSRTIDRVFTGAQDQGFAGVVTQAGTITDVWFCPAHSASTSGSDTTLVGIETENNGGPIFAYTFDADHPCEAGIPVQCLFVGSPGSDSVLAGDVILLDANASGPDFDPGTVIVDGVFTIVIG